MLGDLVREGRGFVPAVNRRLFELIDAGWTEERVRAYDGTDDKGEYPDHPFRVSELYRLCPRMVALARRAPICEGYDAESLWNFAVGTAYHDAIHAALGALPSGVFQGWWSRHPETVIRGADYGFCARPDGDDWKYVEMGLFDDARGLRGHCDGILVWAPDDVEVLELKSVATFQADKHNPQRGGTPKEDHIIQAHGYMLLLGLDRARIAYLVKASGDLGMVMMEHVVRRDEATIEGIEVLLRDCHAARALGPTDPLPDPMAACDKRSRKRPGKCPAKARCFECR